MFNILLIPLLALITGWESKDIEFTWTPRGNEYEYIVEVYKNRELTEIYTRTPPINTYYTYITFTDTGLYFVKVKYYISNTDIYGYEYIGQKYINLEHEHVGESDEVWFPEDEVWFPEDEDIQQEEYTEEKPQEEVKDYHTPTIFSLPKDIDLRENLIQSNSAVLGSSTNVEKEPCNIYMFRDGEDIDVSFYCNLGIKITNVKYIKWKKYFTLYVEGIYKESILANIKIYECKRKILDPISWFECRKTLVDSYEGLLPLRYIGYIEVDGKKVNSEVWGFGDRSFFVKNIYNEDIRGRDVKLHLEISGYVKGNEWIDVISNTRKRIKVPELEKGTSTKPFSFPFKENIGVNQWYGCTVYQCPHSGIDFGAYLNTVLSIGDGTVISTGYDRYGGECFQGGKYVIVRHTNGMYSTYFHLDSYRVKKGDPVIKGTILGITGNSGKWNCQNLGYHLHFETRENRVSSSHKNPTKYIDIDWDLIPTLNYKKYPNRLSGENPHPNF